MLDWTYKIDQIRKSAWLPWVITAVFILAICFTLYKWIESYRTPTPVVQSTVAATTAPIPLASNMHLFGLYDAQTANIPITHLQMTLQGTVVDERNPGASHALILTQGSTTKVYQVGDFLPGNAKVEKIEPHTIILSLNGEYQKLRMEIMTLPNIEIPKSDEE